MESNFMQRALDLAVLGEGLVSPNPLVGAVFVKDGKVVAEGYHKEFGGDHAEVCAICDAETKGVNLEGADLYVSLEPCCMAGKTPACVDALVGLGLRKIYVAMTDPNPLVDGNGVQKLREAGYEVEVGCMEKEARTLNQSFICWIQKKRPYVTLKSAVSLDGKICCRDGSSKWITGEEARNHAHIMRRRSDAILVGVNTVLADDPHLGVRGVEGKDPLRVILDSKLRVSTGFQVFRDENVVVFTTSEADVKKREELLAKGVRIIDVGESVDVERVLNVLGGEGVASVLVEGGAEINGAFVDAGLVDRFVLFVAPKIIGGVRAKSAIGGDGVGNISETIDAKTMHFRQMGQDVMIDAKIHLY